jgi:hypothetical protein
MKKLTISLFIAAFLLLFAGNTQAQNISAGGGIVYSTDINNIGISLNGTYKYSEKIEIAPSFTYYLEKDYVTWKEFFVDGHYKFMKKEGMDIYAITGVGITVVTINWPNNWFGSQLSTSASNIGVNIGIGAKKNFGAFDVFAETKYNLSSSSHLSIGAGVLYKF